MKRVALVLGARHDFWLETSEVLTLPMYPEPREAPIEGVVGEIK